MRSKVDLPQPDGPSREKNSPSRTFSEMDFSASKSPKDLRSPEISIIGFDAVETVSSKETSFDLRTARCAAAQHFGNG